MTCRVCGRDLFPEPLLRYAGMPRAAQNFPDAAALAQEAGVDLEVCQCEGCGLVQLRGEPVPYHREVIRAAGVSEVVKAAKTRQFAAFLETYGLRGRKVLEVGCGGGEFLDLLRPMDVDAYGLEYSASAVAACAARGLKVIRGYPGPGALPHGPFDAFLLLMFLEHMPEPGAVLKAIRDNLAEGAVGLVEVPNFDMVVRTRLFSEFTPDHLFYFTRETFETTLRSNGFDLVSHEEIRDDYVLSAVVRKRQQLDLSPFHAVQARIKADLEGFLDGFGPGRVAVWGAGHQALATLAMTGIRDRLRYIVDSAPFKQGLFSPATHLPILAPDALRSDPPDAVLVMAAAYSDEVAAILRRQYDPGLAVAILRDSGLERVT